MTLSRVSQFVLEQISRRAQRVPPEAAPLDQCWALHAPGAAADPEDAWRRAYAAAIDNGAPPAATPAELRGGIADEALDRFVGTFLS